MKWPDEEQEKKDTAPSQPAIKPVNQGLTVDEMRALETKYAAKYPGDIIQPFIIKTTRVSANRFYIIRAIPLGEQDKIDELFLILKDEEEKALRKKGSDDWKRVNKIPKDDDVPEDKKDEHDAYVNQFMDANIVRTHQIINFMVMNALGVVFPEDHKEKILDKKVPGGDVPNIGMAVQVISGYSDVETDIEVYNQREVEAAFEEEFPGSEVPG